MKILYVVPARAGSQRLPGKNMMRINGVPLVGHAIGHAQSAERDAQIVVTTNDPAVKAYCANMSCVRLVEQPDRDNDWTGILEHAVSEVSRPDIFGRPDVIVLLQCTSPLRTGKDIREAVAMLKSTGADGVISVTPTADNSDGLHELGWAGRLRPVKKSSSATQFVVPNGAIFMIRTNAMERGETWWSGLTYAYLMPRERSVDIDTIEDFRLAEAIMMRGHA